MVYYFFVSCSKYYGINDRISEIASDILKDDISFKSLNKICHALGITRSVSSVDETGKQHNSK
jgi:hypothetical protein